MKKILLGLIMLSGLAVTAQDTSEKDPQAKLILDQLSAKTKTFSSISAEFRSTLVNKAADLNVKQEGKLKMQGEKYRLNLGNHLIISDGTTTWTYSKEDNEVFIDNNVDIDDEDMIKPSELFTIWESGFKFQYKGEQAVGSKNCDIIHLYPTDAAKKNFHTIKLYIDKIKLELVNIEVIGKSGNNYTYALKTFTPNSAVTAVDFKFNKDNYPAVEEIDNR
ncbi:MAG: outer membrane lipoprotein-sorting protein [Flavobacteriales bacterium]|jgi:outer membrane lipoprotein-sorting protein